jgi:transposase InsO family protein
MIARDTHGFTSLEEKVMFSSTLRNSEPWWKRRQENPSKSFHSDQGGEYKSGDFIKYCKDHGIVQQFTVPHTPQQNKSLKGKTELW